MEYFHRRLSPGLPGVITIKESELSPDLRSAKVYLSVMDRRDRSKEVLELLERQKSVMQKSVSKILKTKFCLRLYFYVNCVVLD